MPERQNFKPTKDDDNTIEYPEDEVNGIIHSAIFEAMGENIAQ